MHSLSLPPFPDVNELSPREQIAQMIVVRASGHLFDHQVQYPAWEPNADILKRWIAELGVGGVILLGGSAAEISLRTQQLQSWARIPLLLAADIEEGVGQRFAGATWFPPPMAIAPIARQDLSKAIHYATQMGATTAQEAIAVGLNWILAPVVDVNNNLANPVINVRAFGDDAEMVGQLGAAFIQGAHHHPVLTSAKHFPGHGDTAMDSHLDLPTLPHSLERLRKVELRPFRAAIAAGVDSVMSAHLRFPALDTEYPATLSFSVLTGLLRTELGFDGLIVTDALIMGAIANHYGKNEAAIMAIEAGADILLMPLDAEGIVDAVETAIAEGRLSAERIQESVERIWWAKQRVGQNLANAGSSHAWETLPPQPIDLSQLSTPAARATAQAILQDSMMVSVDKPLPSVKKGLNIILLDDRFDAHAVGHHTAAIATPPRYGYNTLLVIDRYTPSNAYDLLPTSTDPIVLQVWVRGNPFRGTAGLSGTPQQWLDAVLAGDRLQGVIVYGSPYMLDYFRAKIADSLPVIFSFGQMPLAQELAMQALFDPSHDVRGIPYHSSRFT